MKEKKIEEGEGMREGRSRGSKEMEEDGTADQKEVVNNSGSGTARLMERDG